MGCEEGKFQESKANKGAIYLQNMPQRKRVFLSEIYIYIYIYICMQSHDKYFQGQEQVIKREIQTETDRDKEKELEKESFKKVKQTPYAILL